MIRAREESGFALLSAIVVLFLLLTLGIGLASRVDTQTRASGVQRQRDAAFNLAETVLAAQTLSLARDWPGAGNVATPYPTCTPASTALRCPGAAVLADAPSREVDAAATWTSSVHDNDAAGAQAFYSEQTTRARPGYDANRDGRVWVRASATTRGRTRTVVALVGTEEQEEPMPQAAILAGRLEISNQGNKPIVNANGGLVAVRCTPGLIDLTACLGHKFGSGKHGTLNELLGFLATQIAGGTPVTNYTGGAALDAAARARLRARAIADGTWFATCPSAAQLTGRVVHIESGNCSYTSNTQVNSPTAPGLLTIGSGSITFGGTLTFHGVVHAQNLNGASGWAVRTDGNARVDGGVLIDGPAGLLAGSSSLNVSYNSNAFRAVASYGSAGVVQNTWREVRGG